MALDYALPFRRGVLSRLKGFAPLIELVPAASLYPSTVPASRTFPFGRFGSIVGAPFLASGLHSAAFRFSYQFFTKPVMNGQQIVETAEDRILKIGSEAKDCLDGATITLEDSAGKLRVAWITTSPRMDGDEAEAWMTTVTFRGEIAG
jgi:hypothetical protein